MGLEVVQWQWDPSQNPFRSIASYCPVLRQLRATGNVSWHTANNTVSSRRAGGRAGVGAGHRLVQGWQWPWWGPCLWVSLPLTKLCGSLGLSDASGPRGSVAEQSERGPVCAKDFNSRVNPRK